MPLHTGKRPATPSVHDFKLSDFLDIERVLAAPAKPVPHDKGFPLQMYGNGPDDTVEPGFDGAGDCFWACMCEMIHLSEHAAGKPLCPLNGKSAIQAYSAATGYRIGDASTDQGTDMGEGLAFMRNTGIVDLNGQHHTIGAYLSISPGSVVELTAALRAFEAISVGILFPDYAMTEFDAHKAWNYKAGYPEPQDGHCIPIVRETSTGWDVESWSRELAMNKAFWSHNGDEAFAIVNLELLNDQGKTPEGLDATALVKALAALKS